jgi:AraC-like DNA-binding protein/mannose-6-phosphate isomerase-like protein (cupin superfamily)
MAVRTLDDGAWRRALDDGSLRLAPSLSGHPRGRLRLSHDWDTRERILDEHLVYVCRRGRITATVSGNRRAVEPGTVSIIPPGLAFRFRAEAGAEPLLARFRFSARLAGKPVGWGTGLRHARLDDTLERLVDLIIDGMPWETDDRLADDLTRAFCRAADRASVGTPVRGGIGREQLAALAVELARRPCSTGPRELARRLGLSLDWAGRLFRASTGMPLRTWILHERMRLACDLLDQGLTLSMTATRLGYRDPRLFGRQFRSVRGMSPGAWQRRLRREC